MKTIVHILLCLLPYTILSQNLEFEEIKDIPGAYVTSIQELSTGDIIITTPQGVWSGNAALSGWKKISSGIADSTVLCSAIGVNNMIFVGTSTGVYKSSNLGLQWIKTGSNFSSKEVRHLSVHPDGFVYAGVQKRLYRSKDNGVTWQIFADSIMKLYTSQAQFGIAHYGTNGRIIVMTHYTDDDGKKWKESWVPSESIVYRHYPNNQGFFLNYQTGSNGSIFLTCADTVQPIGKYIPGEFLVSNDNGASWGISFYNTGSEKQKVETITKEQYHNFLYLNRKELELKILPLNNDTLIFFPYQGLPIIVQTKVIRVKDAPPSVQLFYTNQKMGGLTSTEIMCTKKLRNGRLLIGTYGSGIFYSDNNGLKWSKVFLPIKYPIFTSYARDDVSRKSYIGTTDGLYEFDETNNKWNEIILKDTIGKCITDIAIRPKDRRLFILGREGIYEREDNNWKTIYFHKERPLCRDILFYGDTMMIETNSTSYYSTDFNSWSKFTLNGQEKTGGGFFLYYKKKYAFPFTIGREWIGYYAKLDGNIKVEDGLPVFRIHSQTTGEKSLPYVFATTEINDNDLYLGNEAGVFKLDFANKIWVQNNKTGLTKARVLSLSSNQTGELFAGTLTGAYRSNDQADTWTSLPDFPTKAVRTIAIDNKGYVYAGLAWGGIYRSKQPSIYLQAPELTTPPHKSNEVRLKSSASWKKVKYANKYQIQIAEDSLFTNIVIKDSSLEVNVKPLNGLLIPNTQYYWRVCAMFGNFRSEWSKTYTFSTETKLPEKPLLSKPTDKSFELPETLVLQWSKSIETPLYHIQLSRNKDFSIQEIEDSTLTTAEKSITNLEVGTNYFWRVRGKNKAGYGLWSDVWSFTTKNISSISQGNISLFSIVQHGSTVKLHGIKSSLALFFSITNLHGKELLMRVLSTESTDEVVLCLDELPSGIYIAKLNSSDNQTLIQKIIITH